MACSIPSPTNQWWFAPAPTGLGPLRSRLRDNSGGSAPRTGSSPIVSSRSTGAKFPCRYMLLPASAGDGCGLSSEGLAVTTSAPWRRDFDTDKIELSVHLDDVKF